MARPRQARVVVEAGLTSFDAQLRGELDVVSGDFLRLTGREPLVSRRSSPAVDELPLPSAGSRSRVPSP